MDDSVTINYDEILAETKKAVLVAINCEQYWLPRKNITLFRVQKRVTLPNWLLSELKIIA